MIAKQPFQRGDVVRYGAGGTALMQIEYSMPNKGAREGLDWHGLQCMGGRGRAHETQMRHANDRDMEEWNRCAKVRGKSPDDLMSPDEFTRIRRKRDLSRQELARWLRLAPANSYQTIVDWETGKKPVSGPASAAMEWFDAGGTPKHVRGGTSDRTARAAASVSAE